MTCHKGWSRDCAARKIVGQGDAAETIADVDPESWGGYAIP